MLQINGIDYKQPTDYAIVAYNGGKYALISDGNTQERVLLSELAESAHTHDAQTITPARVGPSDLESYLYLGDQWNPVTSTVIRLESEGGIYFRWSTPNDCVFQPISGKIWNYCSTWTWAPGAGHIFKADDFVQHASFAADKENLADLEKDEGLLSSVKPRTFDLAGRKRIGFVVDDFVGHPDVLTYDHEGKIDGYSQLSLLGHIWRTVQDLLARVKNLEKLILVR